MRQEKKSIREEITYTIDSLIGPYTAKAVKIEVTDANGLLFTVDYHVKITRPRGSFFYMFGSTYPARIERVIREDAQNIINEFEEAVADGIEGAM